MRFEGRNDWGTPAWLFDQLHKEFRFTVDAAAQTDNAKLDRFWSEQIDGLSKSWAGERVFCNPPYGSLCETWTHKASEQQSLAEVSVLLLPVRSETRWWHEYVIGAASELRFIRGRVHFDPPPGLDLHALGGSRPVFASALAIYRRRWTRTVVGPLVTSMPTPAVAEKMRQMELPVS